VKGTRYNFHKTVAIILILGALIGADVRASPRSGAGPLESRWSGRAAGVPIYSEWIGTTDHMVNADIKAQVTGYLLRQNYKEGSL